MQFSVAVPLLAFLSQIFMSGASTAVLSPVPPSFVHAPKRLPKDNAIDGRKRNHDSVVVRNSKYSYDVEDSARSPNGSKRRRTNNNNKRRRYSRPLKTGLSNIIQALGGPVGAPELPVLQTKDPRIIERWLGDNTGSDTSILGFDIELAKPPWKPERQSLPDGPATVQLSTPNSCIIIQLSCCGDGSASHAPEILRSVINNPNIIKVGVGIDDDALELYRWSKESLDNTQLWEMKSRFDLGCILPDNNPSRRSGIRELAQKGLGVEINKSKVCIIQCKHVLRSDVVKPYHNLRKKLSMSNWGKRYLSLEQISYAARDAWVSAALVEQLQKGNIDVFETQSIMEMDFIKNERGMEEMDARAASRKEAKLELKGIIERERSEDELTNESDEERKQVLYKLLDLYRPDQPPSFSDGDITLPLF